MKLKQTLIGLSFVLIAASIVAVVQVSTSYAALQCSILPQKEICDKADAGALAESGTWALLRTILQIMTGLIGVVAVGAIGYAGFLYATAQDDSNQTKQAKEMIRNTIVGLVLYALMFVAMQFLVPGGVFG